MKQNIYLFQPQYAVEYRKEKSYWIPYSVGCIWAYVNQFQDIQDNFELQDIIFRREPPDDVLDRLENPVLCGFSCYVWNFKYCSIMAEKIKKKWPNCVIVFGGAQSSGNLIKHEFIDSIIIAEGEENFLEILRRIIDKKPPELLYQKRRLQQLDLPSPYTTGVFDKILSNNPGALWSMTFETNRGCPYSCTFCDWGGATYSKVRKLEIDRIREDLEWAIGRPITYVICADANFGIFKERDMEIAKIIKSVSEKSLVDAVNLQYAKNSTETVFSIARFLGSLNRGITISVQSMNDDTLIAIKRKNLDVNNISHLMHLSQVHEVPTYTEVILGLPLETLDSWKQGFDRILEMGQHHSIDMWLSQLLENSEMNQPDSRSKYGIKSITAKDYMPLYNPGDWRDIEEEIELVCATNTMTTEELIEGYMYGWMIIHFHINGFSQIIAKYLRYQCNISYRKFYDAMFDELRNKNNFFYDHYNELLNVVNHYMTTGVLLNFDTAKGGHGIHAISYKYIYDNQLHAIDVAIQVAEQITGNLPDSIKNLQNNYVFNPNVSYPVKIESEFDIDTWDKEDRIYNITAKLELTDGFEFYTWRRKGLLKNRIIHQVSNQDNDV